MVLEGERAPQDEGTKIMDFKINDRVRNGESKARREGIVTFTDGQEVHIKWEGSSRVSSYPWDSPFVQGLVQVNPEGAQAWQVAQAISGAVEESEETLWLQDENGQDVLPLAIAEMPLQKLNRRRDGSAYFTVNTTDGRSFRVTVTPN